jgi:UDP-N-acetylglucosamine--N-acetylmuramyl-(pentapeptide) pyrophosphoryl-undecaprenol N-acetylglucosamine transferase
MIRPLNIIIAGGGTGGHLFPGIAAAEIFLAEHPLNRILFAGTGRAMETEILGRFGFAHCRISAGGIKGMGLINTAASIAKIPVGFWQSLRIIQRFKADLILGVGGYSSAPMVLCARMLGIKVVLHEQNILPGITNRTLARFADRICVSFENTAPVFPREKVRVTGNPVRKEIRETCQTVSDRPGKKHPFTVLVIGGSQGAHSMNMGMIDALRHIPDLSRFHFIHQTGAKDRDEAASAYERHGASSDVRAFFNDMPVQYGRADLIFCRAGATTAAEITALGKPAVFIPYPFAADNHQELNARSLVDRKAADMILDREITGQKLAQKIVFYADHPEILENISRQALKMGKPDAAERIVRECYKLCKKNLNNNKLK